MFSRREQSSNVSSTKVSIREMDTGKNVCDMEWNGNA